METGSPKRTSHTRLRPAARLKIISESQVSKVPYHPCLPKERPRWAQGTTPPQEEQPGNPARGAGQCSRREPHPELSGLSLPVVDHGGRLGLVPGSQPWRRTSPRSLSKGRICGLLIQSWPQIKQTPRETTSFPPAVVEVTVWVTTEL